MRLGLLVGACCVSCVAVGDHTVVENVSLTADADWRALGPVTINAGVTVSLNGHSLALSGLAGEGTIEGAGELVKNGGFEQFTGGVGAWSYYQDGASLAVGWDYTRDGGAGPGQTAKGTPWLSINPAEGARACFLQGEHELYQTINVAKAGTYKLTFSYIGRTDKDEYSNLRIHADLDGVSQGYVDCTDRTKFQTKEILLELAAGEHRLSFRGDALGHNPPNNRCACIDAVSLRAVGEQVPDELTLDIPADAEVVNSSVALQGNLKLIKTGEGTLTIARTGQGYTGGTDVLAGTLKAGVRETSWAGTIYGSHARVKVGAGATFDLAGTSNSPAELELAGGLVTNSIPSGTLPFLLDITLTADSTLAGADFGVIREGWQPTAMKMNGHTLNVGIEPDRYFHFVNTAVTGGGQIVVDGGGRLVLGDQHGDYSLAAAETALVMRNASLEMHGGTHDVRNYESFYAGNANAAAANAHLRVFGTFTPHARWATCELQDGAVLNLSQETGAWNTACSYGNEAPEGVVRFAPGATITVNLQDRVLKFGDQLVNWQGAAPTDTAFVFDAATAAAGVEPVATETGLFYGINADSTVAAVAHWTGAGRPGDFSDPANWACTNNADRAVENVLPSEKTLVCFAGPLEVQIPPTAGFAHGSVEFGDCTLTADCDLRGLGAEVRVNGTIDLRGHRLALAGFVGEGTVTDTVEPTGENLLVNGSFETYVGGLSKGNWGYFHVVNLEQATGWLSSSTRPSEGPGLAMGGSPWLGATPTEGAVALFLQGDCAVEQTFTVPADGNYVFSFDYAGRPNYNNLRVHAEFDGISLGHVDCIDAAFTTRQMGVYLTAGTHVLKLRGNARTTEDPHYRCGAVDNVSLRKLAGGEFVLDLDETTRLVNRALTLDGSLRLVKAGAGTLVVAKANQPYLGGTAVDAGTLVCGLEDTAFQGAAYGRGTCLDVAADAVFDMDGWANAPQMVRLAGTIVNTTARGHHHWPGLVNVALTGDAKIDTVRSFAFLCEEYAPTSLAMNGHTLELAVAETEFFEIANTTVTGGGRIVVTGGGIVQFGHERQVMTMAGATTAWQFDNGAVRTYAGTVQFGDYLSNYTGDLDLNLEGGAVISVAGRFAPGTRWHACELLDGATLDLSGLSDVWTPICTFGEEGEPVAAAFAENAQITVDLGTRKVPTYTQIVDWGEMTVPSTVTFKLDAASRAAGRFLVREETGLILGGGCVIYIR